jgi:hypothetical protein
MQGIFLSIPSAYNRVFLKDPGPCFLGIPPRGTLKHNTRRPLLPFADSQIPWIGYGINSIGAESSKKLGVITLSR